MSMVRRLLHRVPVWALGLPLLALGALLASLQWAPGAWGLAGVAALLAGAVLASVHHAEVIAHRLGEPLGTPVSPERHSSAPVS